jgi:hypothetical protein
MAYTSSFSNQIERRHRGIRSHLTKAIHGDSLALFFLAYLPSRTDHRTPSQGR